MVKDGGETENANTKTCRNRIEESHQTRPVLVSRCPVKLKETSSRRLARLWWTKKTNYQYMTPKDTGARATACLIAESVAKILTPEFLCSIVSAELSDY